jgi:nicotinamidase-related amidase
MKNLNDIEIFETLPEMLRPAHTALVVWDVQNALVKSIFNREAFLAALGRLVPSLRGKMPVFYTLITPMPASFQSGWGYYARMRLFRVDDPGKLPRFMAPGTSDREVADAVRPEPGDVVIEKATPNIFLGTNFEPMLRNRSIRSLIFTGIATEMGVEHSAREAGARGFYPVVATDCVSSRDQDAHERSLANLQRLVVTASSADIVKAVSAQTT